MKNSYLTINEQKNKYEINANISDTVLDDGKLNASVKQIVKLLRKNNFKKKEIVINTNLNLDNFDKIDNKHFTLISALNSCKIQDKDKRLEYIYMAACKYLDNDFQNNNICEFCDDVCLGKKKYNMKNGCCHEATLKNVFFFKDFPLCRYLKDKRCIADCLGCKIFTCNDVRKKGFKYTYYNIPLVRYFFNFIQKIIIRFSVFTHKDTVLKRLKAFNF